MKFSISVGSIVNLGLFSGSIGDEQRGKWLVPTD